MSDSCWDVTILCLRGNSEAERYLRKYAVVKYYRVGGLKPTKRSGLAGVVIRLLQRIVFPVWACLNIIDSMLHIQNVEPDRVLLVHSGVPGGLYVYTAAIACGLCRKRTIATVHNFVDYPSGYVPWMFMCEWLTVRFRNVMHVSVSDYCTANIAGNSYAIRSIMTIHNGVEDCNRTGVLPQRSKNLSEMDGTLNILFVGNFLPRKGLHVLMESLALIEGTFKLYIFGQHFEDTYSRQVLDSAKPYNVLVNSCTYDKGKIYPGKHILVLPSIKEESFGLVLIEAMSFGIPVIGSDDFGIKEVIENDLDRQVGMTFAVGNANALAGRINMLAQDFLLWERISANCREVYVEKFKDCVMCERYCSLLE